jgi:hypothetical protein
MELQALRLWRQLLAPGTPPRFSLSEVSFTEAWLDAGIEVSADGYEPQRLTVLDLTKGSLPDLAVYLAHA